MRERVQWRTASPLWAAAAGGAVPFDRPAILRFAGDDFMERFQALLGAGGEGVPDLVAQPETWREPAAGLGAGNGTDSEPVTLYQPAQGRFYLLAATLVCAKYSLPDKPVDPGRRESAFFVVRRLQGSAEQAWIPEGPGGGSWRAAPAGGLTTAEGRLGLFPVTHATRAGARRVLAGLIPVAGREALAAGRTLPELLPAPDPLAALADARLGPLVTLVEGQMALLALTANADLGDVREAFYYMALDVAEYFAEHLSALLDGAGPTALRARLSKADTVRPGVRWLDALRAARAAGPVLAGGALPSAFGSVTRADVTRAIGELGVSGAERDPQDTALFREVAAALPPADDTDGAGGGADDEQEQLDAPAVGSADDVPAVYVARCVYERPLCPPAERLRISAPSRPFRLATFYDPDAPFRPSRIPTPVDTSLDGLRRSPKAVAVSISAELRRQMDRIEGIKLANLDSGAIPGERGLSLGMVCQLSIPIITICALILLLIIVSLLNIVFWWLPFFRICLPTVRRG
jgi:hypothetical protein